MEHSQKKYPIGHVVGLILSLVMTFAAVWVVLSIDLSKTVTMSIIGTLAFLQAGMQLFMFMHVNESENSWIQVTNMAYSIIMALTIVVGSIWVMHN